MEAPHVLNKKKAHKVDMGKMNDIGDNSLGDVDLAINYVISTKIPVNINRLDSLAGTVKADVLLKLYEAIPRIDFTLELGKTISDEVESVFLSLDLNRPGNGTVLRKGAREAFRPGIDQLPGTCMEFYMSDDGAARLSPEGGVLIAARDVPMFYTGEMQHHPIRLCDGAAENNARPLYSWVMNNNWETNFKMDLSGFCQYDYSLWLTDISDPEQAMDELHEQLFDPYVLIVR